MSPRVLVPIVAVASFLGHATLYRMLRSDRPPTRAAHPATLVTIEVPPPPPRPAPPEAAPEKVARTPVVRARVARARPAPAAPPVAAPVPSVPDPAPVADLTGVTLTNDGAGAGWSSAVGNGAAMTGPIGRAGRAAPAARGPAIAAGPSLVPLADLRRRPEPPDLDAALEHNYPEQARREGLTGNAVVRARILPSGAIAAIQPLSASTPTFADACRRTLAGSRWSPPIDAVGNPCATEIRYTCRFELRQ